MGQPWVHDSVQANRILPPQDLLAVGTGLKDDVSEGRGPLRSPLEQPQLDSNMLK